MPDSWIDRKELEELVGSLPGSKRGRRKRKSPPRAPLAPPPDLDESSGVKGAAFVAPTDEASGGGAEEAWVAVELDRGEDLEIEPTEKVEGIGVHEARPEMPSTVGLTPLESVPTDFEEADFPGEETRFVESVFEFDPQEVIEEEEPTGADSGGGVGEFGPAGESLLGRDPGEPPSTEPIFASDVPAEIETEIEIEEEAKEGEEGEGDTDVPVTGCPLPEVEEGEPEIRTQEIETPVIVETLEPPDERRQFPEFLQEAKAEPPQPPTAIERDADRAFRALAEARAKVDFAGLLRLRSETAELPHSSVVVETREVDRAPSESIAAESRDEKVGGIPSHAPSVVEAEPFELEEDDAQVEEVPFELEEEDSEVEAEPFELEEDDAQVEEADAQVEEEDAQVEEETLELEEEPFEQEEEEAQVEEEPFELEEEEAQVEVEPSELEEDDSQVEAEPFALEEDEAQVEVETLKLKEDIQVEEEDIQVKVESFEPEEQDSQAEAESFEPEGNDSQAEAESFALEEEEAQVEVEPFELEEEDIQVEVEFVELEAEFDDQTDAFPLEVLAEEFGFEALFNEALTDFGEAAIESIERVALRERVFRLGERAMRELGACGLVICDEHGLPLYCSGGEEGGEAPPAALLLELSGRTNESLGLGKDGVIQIADGEGGWRCLLPSEGEIRPLYAGLSLGRPLEHGEIDRLSKALAAAVHPLSSPG